MKKIIIAIAATLCTATLTAQETLQVTAETDLVSRYMWRGLDKGGVSLQPFLRFEYQGFVAEAFSSIGFAKDAYTNTTPQELDLKFVYCFPFGLNIGVADFWSNHNVSEDRYFYFKQTETGHRLEANIGYSNSYFTLQAFTTVWGNDFKNDGARAYSTYIEAAVPFTALGINWVPRIGFTPMESSVTNNRVYATTGEGTGYRLDYLYADQVALVLAAIRAEKTYNFRGIGIPLSVELYANPYLNTAGLVGSIGVRFR